MRLAAHFTRDACQRLSELASCDLIAIWKPCIAAPSISAAVIFLQQRILHCLVKVHCSPWHHQRAPTLTSMVCGLEQLWQAFQSLTHSTVDMTHEEEDDQGERLINEGALPFSWLFTNVVKLTRVKNIKHGRRTARSCMT